MTISETQRASIRKSFLNRNLRVLSVSPEGEPQWKPILAAHRTPVPPKPLVVIETDHGGMLLTTNHRVFTSPTSKVDAGDLRQGDTMLAADGGTSVVTRVVGAEPREVMYDITVADWHNFAVNETQVVVSNCPDRNYRFMPPEGEGTIGCYNQVFGYIWTDEEFYEYLEIALWKWNMHPPSTEGMHNIEILCQQKPSWKAALLWGALVNAAQALVYNWIANEFDYSIGGISLSVEKSGKYEGMKQNAEDQWDKLTEAKSRTVHYMRGLAQPRFGRGVRSAFGPHVGRGVLSPRSFVVFCIGIGYPLVQEILNHADNLSILLA